MSGSGNLPSTPRELQRFLEAQFRSPNMPTTLEAWQNMAKLAIWDKEEAKQIYGLPVPAGTTTPEELIADTPEDHLIRFGRLCLKPFGVGHTGPSLWAVDFMVPDGTPVVAAETGVVRGYIDQFDEWGTSFDMTQKNNLIVIAHDSGEISNYTHLEPESVRELGISFGDHVEKGQRIATVGKTGYLDRDHLHFEVGRPDTRPENPVGYKSLRVSFEVGEHMTLQEKQSR